MPKFINLDSPSRFAGYEPGILIEALKSLVALPPSFIAKEIEKERAMSELIARASGA